MRPLILVPFLLSVLVSVAFADSAIQCGNAQQCPSNAPCCSQYGQCGVGAYCLGGCEPVGSFNLTSCMPAPTCQSASYDFKDLSGLVENTEYLGDASKADWVYSGQPLPYNGQVLLTMAQGTVGTLLSSTHYVWYGKTTAKFSTSAGAGVVTAFILLADSKDEIDFEFVGVELNIAQTNFYSQGITNYTNGRNTTGVADVHLNQHSYTIDWKYDSITWSVDDQPVRTLNREDTWNATSNRYAFPQTPARIELSLWPAGLSTNGIGTINWAGGLIDWNSPYMANGYYYAAFDSVTVQCYDPPPEAAIHGSKSYLYTDLAVTNNTVEIIDKQTVLKSFLGNGNDVNKANPSNTASASGSAKTTPATIPGLSGSGPGSDGQRGGGAESSASVSTTTVSEGSAATGFVQGNGGISEATRLGVRCPLQVVLLSSLGMVVVALAAVIAV